MIETRKDGTKFTNRALKDAAERQADVAARYEQLQRDLVAQVRHALPMMSGRTDCLSWADGQAESVSNVCPEGDT